MPAPTWAGDHASPDGISANPQDYIFFLSKNEVPYGCFSNAHREQNNGHSASAATVTTTASATTSSAATEPPPADAQNYHFWCVNQELHYRKAMLFRDRSIARKILTEGDDAAKIKQLGRQVRGYDDATWCEVRYDTCRNALLAKFAQNEELKQILISTGTKIIVEAARDEVWGVGCVEYSSSSNDDDNVNGNEIVIVLGAKNKDTGGWDTEPKDWAGENLLGRCLMDVRKILSESHE